MASEKTLAALVLGILLMSFSAAAGTGPDSLWMRTYWRGNFESAWSIEELAGGGYIVAGRTQVLPNANPDVYILRTDANGDTLWTRRYGWDLIDEPNQVRETSDGNYIVVGKTQAILDSTYYVLLLKIAPTGDTLWTRTYGQGYWYSYGLSVAEVSSGGYILAGGVGTYSHSTQAFLIRTDADGDTLWTKLHGTINQEEIWSIQETYDGGFIGSGGVSQDFYLLRTDANGDTLGTRQYGGPSGELGLSVAETPDSGYIVAGYTWSYGSGMTDAYYVKTDRNGDLDWARAHGGTQKDQVYTVKVTSDDHYISAGHTESFGPAAGNMWLVKMDADGDTVWTAVYGGNGEDRAHSGGETSDGGYILAGSTNSFGAPQHNVYLVKTAPDQSGIAEGTDAPGQGFRLRVLPTPSASRVGIEYGLAVRKHVRLVIYNPLGKQVKVLANRLAGPGTHQVTWDGGDEMGRPVAAGVYFVRYSTDGVCRTSKVVLVR
jgi:hypothetical protein